MEDEFIKGMIGLRLVYMSMFVIEILQSHAKRHWMYSKSWIEDYRLEVRYGHPSQTALTEYTLETHKIGVIQSEDEKSLDDGGYDYRESSTVFRTLRTAAVRNKGERYEGHLVSDTITVPKNVTHELPSLRVDIVLLEKISDETVNFIGLLDPLATDDYASFSSSLGNSTKNSNICYEFMYCGNHLRSDMLSIGYVHVHHGVDDVLNRSSMVNAAVIDPYFFMVVVESLTLNGTSLATCEELNNRGAIFDNTLPGIYLPFTIYRRFMRELFAYADKYDFPKEMRIWETRQHSCYEGPVTWNNIPEMTVTLFATEDETFQVSYSGQSLVQRYYTKNSEKSTFCYIFAVRRADDEHFILGRASFEGMKLFFNRSGKSISFLDNSCCGPVIKLTKSQRNRRKMSSCLPKKLRSGIWHFEAYWIWILALATVVAVLTCIVSAPRPSNQSQNSPPTVHIFIPPAGTSQCDYNCRENSTNTAE